MENQAVSDLSQPLMFGPHELDKVLRRKPFIMGNVMKYQGNYYLAPMDSLCPFVGLKKPTEQLQLPIPCLFHLPQNPHKMRQLAKDFGQEVEWNPSEIYPDRVNPNELALPRRKYWIKLNEADPEVFVEGFGRRIQAPYQPIVFRSTQLPKVLLLKQHLNGNILEYRGNSYLAPIGSHYFVGLKKPQGEFPLPIPCLFNKPQDPDMIHQIAKEFGQTVNIMQ